MYSTKRLARVKGNCSPSQHVIVLSSVMIGAAGAVIVFDSVMIGAVIAFSSVMIGGCWCNDCAHLIDEWWLLMQ